MAKYHLKKDGLPGICTAQSGKCPLGTDEDHYSSKIDAVKASEEILRKEYDLLAKHKVTPVYHVGASGEVEECPYRDGYCEVKPYNSFGNVHNNNENVVEGAAKAFKEIKNNGAPSVTTKINNGETLPKKAQPFKKPLERQSPVTEVAREVLRSGKTDLSNYIFTNGSHKIKEGDTIYGLKPNPNYVYDGCSSSYSNRNIRKRFNTLQDALDAGYEPKDIEVSTIDSCHHSTSVPDFNDPDNLARDSRSKWQKDFDARNNNEKISSPRVTKPVPTASTRYTDPCGGGFSQARYTSSC